MKHARNVRFEEGKLYRITSDFSPGANSWIIFSLENKPFEKYMECLKLKVIHKDNIEIHIFFPGDTIEELNGDK